MTPLDYAAVYAVYVLSSAFAVFLVLRGWAAVLDARSDL